MMTLITAAKETKPITAIMIVCSTAWGIYHRINSQAPSELECYGNLEC